MSRLSIVVVFFIAVGLAACNTQAQWTYPIEASTLYRAAGSQSELAVAVLPFKEERPVVNRTATMWLYLIPGMPFGWVTYERPEAARMFQTIAEFGFQMDEDLGKAATRSLEESHLFRRAYFTLGGELSEADLVFRGSARRTRYYGRNISYGLSAYGPLLWLLGIGPFPSKSQIGSMFPNRLGLVTPLPSVTIASWPPSVHAGFNQMHAARVTSLSFSGRPNRALV